MKKMTKRVLPKKPATLVRVPLVRSFSTNGIRAMPPRKCKAATATHGHYYAVENPWLNWSSKNSRCKQLVKSNGSNAPYQACRMRAELTMPTFPRESKKMNPVKPGPMTSDPATSSSA